MLRLALGKPAQVSLLSSLLVDIAGTHLHAGPFASQALGLASKQEAMMSSKRGSMFISQEDLEEVFSLQKFALQPAQRQTLVLPYPAPSRESSCRADSVNRKLHLVRSLKSQWPLSSKFRAAVKPSLQKEQWQTKALPPPKVCHRSGTGGLAELVGPLQALLFCSLWSQPAPSQLPWKAGYTQPSVWKRWTLLSTSIQGLMWKKHSGPVPGDSEKEGVQSWAFIWRQQKQLKQ